MIDVDDVRGLCADLADNSTGRSGAYEASEDDEP